MSKSFSRTPPKVPDADVSFPRPHILLVTLNRPRQLNAIRRETHGLLDRLWKWYDEEPSLRCAILTGRGRAFCAGADLKEWQQIADASTKEPGAEDPAGGGFGGVSNRRGKKPIIAAVNGLCFGGGFEMAVNTDMIVASASAQFGLPEVKRGVVAIAGALPRLTRIIGRQRATEMALLGRSYTAEQMRDWGVVNHIVAGQGNVVDEALRWAEELCNNSPDSVIVSREGLLGGWDAEDPRMSTQRVRETSLYQGLEDGYNIREGLASFVEKRKTVWKDSKL